MCSKTSNEYKVVSNISGFQNTEMEVEEMLKAEEYSRIKEVKQIGSNVSIVFEHCPTGKRNPSFVKQVSKKKYNNWKQFVYKQELTCINASFIGVIEIENKWLIFFNK